MCSFLLLLTESMAQTSCDTEAARHLISSKTDTKNLSNCFFSENKVVSTCPVVRSFPITIKSIEGVRYADWFWDKQHIYVELVF